MLQLPPVQAVLLAGGGGSRLYPLNASGTPKVLLPVANRPLLTFPLRMLEESGVTDVLVVSGAVDCACCGGAPHVGPAALQTVLASAACCVCSVAALQACCSATALPPRS